MGVLPRNLSFFRVGFASERFYMALKKEKGGGEYNGASKVCNPGWPPPLAAAFTFPELPK
jgi:hypothetical protein